MKTTVLLVEYLAAGFLSATWILLLTMHVTEWELPSESVDPAILIVSIPVLASCYLLGVVQDRVADYLFLAMRIPQAIQKKLSWLAMLDGDDRFEVLSPDRAEEFLGQMRSQVRMVRAFTFNAPLISFAVILIALPEAGLGILWIIGAGLIATVVGMFAYALLDGCYDMRVKQLREWRNSRQQHNPDPNEDAARIVSKATEPDPLPADVEAAWAEWSKGIKNVDERGMTLLRAAFDAGYDVGSSVH